MPEFAPVRTENIQYIAIALSLALFVGVLELIRRGKLREEYSLIWLGSALVFLVFSIWRGAFDAIANFLGIAYGPSLLLLAILVSGFLLLVHFSIIVSRLSEREVRLVQELAIARAIASRPAEMDRRNSDIIVIVPAFNEEAALPEVLRELGELQPEVDIVVVDDASSDATAKVARQGGARLLRLPINLGIGGAVQTGFRYARDLDYEIAIQVDGDGQHPAEGIASLIERIRTGDADAVIGSRFIEGAGFQSTPFRRIGIRAFAWMSRATAGVDIKDTTSGFRAYNRPATAFLAESYASDYPEVEAITQLARNGFTIREVPVQMRERQGGESSISTLRSFYYLVKVGLASAVSAFRPRRRVSPNRRS